ncbi:hypothetical protein D3C84_980990 [compost metagenome]
MLWGPNIDQPISSAMASIVENLINLKDAGIHRIPLLPSTPNIFSQSCGIPKPAKGAIKVAADRAEDNDPYSLGPNCRANIT